MTLFESLRQEAAARADFRCEYCLVREAVSFYRFHLEHIKSRKHGGLTTSENLAYSCPECNAHKGTDVGTFTDDDERLVRFFNPRKDVWTEHFEIDDAGIYGISEIGKATEKILRFNDAERLIYRRKLMRLGLYL
ncbi:MAG: HNH endonuclease [Lewinellaceae bacterium]|nr:HNH endonuclease [Lewinellaceae bacterium]